MQEKWSDYDHGWSNEVIEMQAESMDTSVEDLENSLRRGAWLEDQDLQTVLKHECDEIERVDHDTRLEHNVHVYTSFTDFPSEMVTGSGFDAWLGWFIDLRGTINRYTEYRITNKREIGGKLVLTLAPE